MAETVTTGGLKTFSYRKGEMSKLDEERKKDIEKAYGRYYERRKRERERNTLLWIVIVLLIVLALAIFLLRS